jgi:mycoredoxin-dependent peroxiredoxin
VAPEVGDEAPDFELKDQHGTPVRLSGFRGAKNVVVVFYPFAFSGVCSGEMCAMRDQFPEVARDDVELLGRHRLLPADLGGPAELRFRDAL